MKRIKIISFLLLIICSIILGKNNTKEANNSAGINNNHKIVVTSEIEIDKVGYKEKEKIILDKYHRQIEILKDERRQEINLLKQDFGYNIETHKRNVLLKSESKPIKLDRKFIKIYKQ